VLDSSFIEEGYRLYRETSIISITGVGCYELHNIYEIGTYHTNDPFGVRIRTVKLCGVANDSAKTVASNITILTSLPFD
jgi:hypothetical protein